MTCLWLSFVHCDWHEIVTDKFPNCPVRLTKEENHFPAYHSKVEFRRQLSSHHSTETDTTTPPFFYCHQEDADFGRYGDKDIMLSHIYAEDCNNRLCVGVTKKHSIIRS